MSVNKIKRRVFTLSPYNYKLTPKREPNFESRKDFRARRKEISANLPELREQGIGLFLRWETRVKKLLKEKNNQEKSIRSNFQENPFERVLMELMYLEMKNLTMIYQDIRKHELRNLSKSFLLDVFSIPVMCFCLIIPFRLTIYTSLFLAQISVFLALTLNLIVICIHRIYVRKKNFRI